MTTNLSTALCSITPTQRRRYFWAAWWTGQPSHSPFRKPDAAHGGARTFEEALVEAEAVAGRSLTMIDPYWARAWKTILRGQDPSPPPAARATAPRPAPAPDASAWSVLGLSPGASLADVRRAFQRRALETHPDQGGEAEAFQKVQRAYEKLVDRLAQKAKRR
ncbi:MAG TPA: J domain-containing protein [Polyangiales bacterium]|nr:J domain-containing protein [Polyangiales bacterium]